MPKEPLKPSRVQGVSAQTAGTKNIQLTAPVGGLNYRDPLPSMEATDALVLDNFIARQSSIELRGGYREFFTKIKTPVDSIMSYQPGIRIQNKLFAATPGKIVDITGGDPVFNARQKTKGKSKKGTTPVGFDASISIPEDYTGVWSYINYSLSNKKYLIAVNNGGGYWTYDYEEGWKKRKIEGLPGDNFTSISVWQNRVWLTFDNSSTAYYLGIGEILEGAKASPFDYGPMFRSGGNTQSIANWTYDSGYGVNDFQLIFSSGGDCLVYKGTDPDNADTYSLVGCWYIGVPPTGDRFHTKYAGDTYVLTDLGVVSINALVSGKNVTSGLQNGIISKIQPKLSGLLSQRLFNERWEIRMIPWLDVLLITVPQNPDGTFTQYVQCLTSSQWSTFSNIPIYASELHEREFYFADTRGMVYEGLRANNDGELIDGSQGDDIVGSFMTAFQDFGAPANLKRFLMVKPMFLSANQPVVAIDFLIDYRSSSNPDAYLPPNAVTALWDEAKWDENKWASSDNAYTQWTGISGVGYTGSLQMRVKGDPKTTYIGSMLSVEVGGTM